MLLGIPTWLKRSTSSLDIFREVAFNGRTTSGYLVA